MNASTRDDIIFSDHDRTGLANIIRKKVHLPPGKSHFFRRSELEKIIRIIDKTMDVESLSNKDI